MTARLLGVQIANGYSSEASVFAGLLAQTDRALLEPHVLHHQWAGDLRSIEKFRDVGIAPLQPLDFGWRSMTPGRSLPAKARARLRFLAALPRALALARRINPDVVYSCQQLWDCQAATYLARKLGKPQVIHLHYIIGPWLHKPVLGRLRTCAHVVAVSDFIREEALRHGVGAEKVTTVRNTAPATPPPDAGARAAVRAELGIAPDAPLLGIVARLDPDKGQADTLRAFAQARGSHPGLQLLVVGDPSPWHPGYAGTLGELAERLGAAETVHFLGRRSDVPRLLAAMDLFVHPSRRDPCPLALLEAADASLPAVAYAEGGANELVQDGVTGLLAAPGDVDALARSILCLLDDLGRARAMGRAGRKRIARDFQPALAGQAFTSLIGRVAGLEVD